MSHENAFGRRRTANPATLPPNEAKGALGIAATMGASDVRFTILLQFVRTIFRILLAGLIAIFTGHLIAEGTFNAAALVGAITCLCLLGGVGILVEFQAARAEARLADRLRVLLRDLLSSMPTRHIRTRPGGALIAGLQRHPDALASLVIGHSAARSMLGIGPFVVAAALAILSWEAALTLLVTIPVMVVFFILLGAAVRDRAEMQESKFGQLAAQFSDRIRTLPTILASHTLRHEQHKLERRMTAYADSTMNVLAVAFLNAGIIDFFLLFR